MSGDDRDRARDERVVPLPSRGPAPEPPPSRPGRLQGLATFGMAACAFVGIATMLAFVTVRWPSGTGRYVVAVFVAAIVGFLTCASLAVLSAARDTYPRRAGRRDVGD